MKTKSEYEVVRYRPEHKRAVAELQRHLWTSDVSMNIAYLEWKHERNPYLSEPLIYLACCDGKPVAMRSMFGVNWETGTPPMRYPGICPDDMVIEPAHRNIGLATVLMKAVFKDLETLGHDRVFSLSAGKITRLTSLAMGWRAVGSVRPHRWRSSSAERLQRLGNALRRTTFLWRISDLVPHREWGREQCSIHELCNPQGMPARRIGGNLTVERDAKPGDMARLISRIEYDGRIRHVRDAGYLEWRFRNPIHRYIFLYRWDGDGLGGYLVLQQYLSDLSDGLRVNIVDWEGTSLRIRAELLQAALRLHPFFDLTIWTVSLGEDSMRLLGDAGFRPVPEGQEGAGVGQEHPCLLVRGIPGGPAAPEPSFGGRRLEDISQWDIRMLYSMQG
ncbi:MAG: GNAT family N-acetyltransferase [Thermodesulfobacteriota bacterium]